LPSGIALLTTVWVMTSGAKRLRSATLSSVTFLGASAKLWCVGLRAWQATQWVAVICMTSASETVPVDERAAASGTGAGDRPGAGAVKLGADNTRKAAVHAVPPEAPESSPASARLKKCR